MMMVAHKEYERKRDQMRFAYKSLVVAALSSSKRNNTPITDRGWQEKVSDWLVYKIYNDALFGPRIKRRVQRLLLDHPEGLTERGHDWYFGYLVCAYTQVYFGIKTLLNYQSVTQEIFQYCFQQEN